MNKTKLIIISIIILLLAAGASIGGYFAYQNSTPVKVRKGLELAERYMTEQNYEQAIVVYDAVIAIDPLCGEAYDGKISAMVSIAEVRDDCDAKLDGLLQAYLNYEVAEKMFENSDMEEANKAKALNSFAENKSAIVTKMNDIITDYVSELKKKRDKAKILELKGKYGEYVDFDFDGAIKEIEDIEAERKQAMVDDYLEKAYIALSTKDYKTAIELQQYTITVDDAGEEHYALPDIPQIVMEDSPTYVCKVFDGEGNSGIGAGIYFYDFGGDCPEMFLYYGQISNGICEGEGTWFSGSNGLYTLYRGQFTNNIPNGYIVEEESRLENEYISYTEGMMVDGLWDGTIKNYDNDYNIEMYSEYEMGKVKNRTAEYTKAHSTNYPSGLSVHVHVQLLTNYAKEYRYNYGEYNIVIAWYDEPKAIHMVKISENDVDALWGALGGRY